MCASRPSRSTGVWPCNRVSAHAPCDCHKQSTPTHCPHELTMNPCTLSIMRAKKEDNTQSIYTRTHKFAMTRGTRLPASLASCRACTHEAATLSCVEPAWDAHCHAAANLGTCPCMRRLVGAFRAFSPCCVCHRTPGQHCRTQELLRRRGQAPPGAARHSVHVTLREDEGVGHHPPGMVQQLHTQHRINNTHRFPEEENNAPLYKHRILISSPSKKGAHRFPPRLSLSLTHTRARARVCQQQQQHHHHLVCTTTMFQQAGLWLTCNQRLLDSIRGVCGGVDPAHHHHHHHHPIDTPVPCGVSPTQLGCGLYFPVVTHG